MDKYKGLYSSEIGVPVDRNEKKWLGKIIIKLLNEPNITIRKIAKETAQSIETIKDWYMEAMPAFKISFEDEQRFWSQVFVRRENECWEFVGGTMDKLGRGRFHLNGHKIMAQRVAYAIEYGFMPELGIKRICRNINCVNPKHLIMVGEL